jgi:N-acetylmuramoyl-L-alanine amidase-like protein
MSGIYYTDMLTVLRAAGCRTAENAITAGWQQRARSSGGFPAPPLGVFWHHTASSTTPENDLAWMINGSDDAPIGNLLIDRTGTIWPIAAGASNCAGKGGPARFSRGEIPADSGNTRGFQIEVANNGTGEPWPQAQIDAYFAASNALNAHVGNRPDDVITHSLGAGDGWTDRKIDPATAAAVQGPWRPRSIGSSGTWSLADIRAECAARAGTTPPPTPTPTPPPDPGPAPPLTLEEDNMIVALDANGTAWIGDGFRRYNPTEEDFSVKVLLAGDDCIRLVNTQGGRVNGWGSVYTVDDNVIAALGRPT